MTYQFISDITDLTGGKGDGKEKSSKGKENGGLIKTKTSKKTDDHGKSKGQKNEKKGKGKH